MQIRQRLLIRQDLLQQPLYIPAIECTPLPTCPPGRGLILDEQEQCVCPPGYYSDSKGYCVLCQTEIGFVLIGNQYICNSERGLVPLQVCMPTRHGAWTRWLLYPYLYGTATGHPCICKCIEGYFGNPLTGCSKYHFFINSCSMFSVAVPIPTLPPVPKDINRPELQINCLADGILIQINLKDDNFKGVMATAMKSVAASLSMLKNWKAE